MVIFKLLWAVNHCVGEGDGVGEGVGVGVGVGVGEGVGEGEGVDIDAGIYSETKSVSVIDLWQGKT